MDLNNIGSSRISKVLEINASVDRSKMPLCVGPNLVFIEMLLRYSVTSLCEKGAEFHEYLREAFFIGDK